MDLSEIHPFAAVAGVVGGLIGFMMVKRIEAIGMLWKILTPIASAVGGFFIMQKMASD